MKPIDFENVARSALPRFPRSERYGTLDYNVAMDALVDAGFTFRPTWQLVDSLRAVVQATNPVSFYIGVDAAYCEYFGPPPAAATDQVPALAA